MTGSQRQVSGHEVGIIRAFIVPHRQERFLTLLENPKARRKLLAHFSHLGDAIRPGLDLRFAHRIPPGEQTRERIYSLLKDRGAPDICHVMGPCELDGQDVELWEALNEIFELSFGNFLSCIPGKLAYFGGENYNERYILER
jgi:hypothetical protein